MPILLIPSLIFDPWIPMIIRYDEEIWFSSILSRVLRVARGWLFVDYSNVSFQSFRWKELVGQISLWNFHPLYYRHHPFSRFSVWLNAFASGRILKFIHARATPRTENVSCAYSFAHHFDFHDSKIKFVPFGFLKRSLLPSVLGFQRLTCHRRYYSLFPQHIFTQLSCKWLINFPAEFTLKRALRMYINLNFHTLVGNQSYFYIFFN